MQKILENKLTLFACIFLFLIYFLAFFAPFFAPYNPNQLHSSYGYMEPSKIYLDKEGLYVFEKTQYLDKEKLLKKSKEIKDKKYRVSFFNKGKIIEVESPGELFILGTDSLGRDLFSRLVFGARPSLTIGFISLIIAFPLGLLYGGISGYFGGVVDNLMMRVAEAIMSLPSFYLLIILSALLPANLSNFQRFAMITFILSFISWAGLARIIRGQVLSIKEKEFIESAKSIGLSNIATIVKHLIPHTFSFVVISATLSVPSFIIGETALSFLGLGINQPDPSWGNILAEGKELSNILTRPWLLWAPASLIFFSVFSFNIIGDSLRDYFDPKAN
jgi:peptide/nickel transport system permease protein